MDEDKVEVKSRRQLLEEAWDKSEETVDEEKPGESGGDSVRNETVQSSDDKREETQKAKGRDSKAGVEEKAEAGAEGKQKVDEAVQQELKASKKIESGKQNPPQLAPTDRAPNSWKPAVREHWATIPAEARAEIQRRELELEQTLTQTATMRKFATDFAHMVAPYQHIIRAQNSTPLQAVDNLMKTAASLASGSPQQRAETVGHIIANYGVDIKMLDEFLTKNYNPQTAQYNQQQNSAPPQWAQPIFEWMNRAQHSQQQYEQQQRTQAENEIAQMQSEPFFEDLRDDIADLMEIAAKRGKSLSLKDAYKKAIELDPEISRIVKQREEAKATTSVSQAASTLARAKKATKTLAGAPKQDGGGSGKPKTRREMLSEAWDDAIP